MFSPAAGGEADEEDAEAPARVEGGASSSVANAGAEGAASTAGFSSSGAVAVSVTARRAVRNRVDLGTADVIGDEAIWFDGAVSGWVTSGGYAHHSGKSVAMGYVPREIADEANGFEIELLGRRLPARIQAMPLFDANFERMRG